MEIEGKNLDSHGLWDSYSWRDLSPLGHLTCLINGAIRMNLKGHEGGKEGGIKEGDN